MKIKSALFLFLLISTVIFSQKKAIKKVQTKATQIEISTEGLDNFVLENSTSEFIEIYLTAENSNKQHIVYKEVNNTVKIEFKFPDIATEETVFRKFITKRLQRASVIVKIPQNKPVIIFGNSIDIASKSYGGSLDIYIEKGILKLDTIKANTKVKLYAGSVFATLKKGNIDAASNTGTISINRKIQQEKFYKKSKKSAINFTIASIKANIFLTIQKTQ
jgi:hypothetical protein